MDNKTAAKIIDEMRERSNKTILMISHQLSVAATCDRVLVIDKGELVQEGKHKDQFKRRGFIKDFGKRTSYQHYQKQSNFYDYDKNLIMFEFLNRIMNINDSNLTNTDNSVHRILKQILKKIRMI